MAGSNGAKRGKASGTIVKLAPVSRPEGSVVTVATPGPPSGQLLDERDPQVVQLLQMDERHNRKRIHLEVTDNGSAISRFIFPDGVGQIQLTELLLKAFVDRYFGGMAPAVVSLAEEIGRLRQENATLVGALNAADSKEGVPSE